MSANIYFMPDVKKGTPLNTPAPSSFIETLERAGYTLPYTFDDSDKKLLLGMACARERQEDNPYRQLIEAIDNFGRVRVWAEY